MNFVCSSGLSAWLTGRFPASNKVEVDSVTRDYVRGLEVVFPNGNVVQLGGKVVKNSSGHRLRKRPYLSECLAPEVIMLMQGVKAVFDPKHILNPHKVCQ